MSRFAEPHATQAEVETTNAHGETILVVDDEASIVAVLCMLLEDEGFAAIGETDPLKAAHAIRSYHPCLLLTDIMMPGMSGYELAALAEAIEPDMHVVFMSAVVDNGRRGRPFIAKPFDLGQVMDVVDDALRAS